MTAFTAIVSSLLSGVAEARRRRASRGHLLPIYYVARIFSLAKSPVVIDPEKVEMSSV
jgi:hypothetical protein